MPLPLLLSNASVVLAMTTLLWLVSVRLRDASIVDPWWSMLSLAVVVNTALRTGLGPKKVVLLVAVGLWAIRLWLHLLLRSRGKPEDPRYAAFRTRYGADRYGWISLFQVFWLQGALSLVVSAPLQLAAAAPATRGLGLVDGLGLAVFLVGFALEAAADLQLQRFRNDPGSKGKVLDTGLFALSRHPNYFGETLVAWGLGALALSEPWGAVALVGPALMTFLLVRVSGVTMLDEYLTRTRPGYAEYVARTPAFLPRWPRRAR